MMKSSSAISKVRRLFKKLKSDKRAIVLPMFAIMFAAMLAFLGLLFDGGRMYFEKRRMQVAADAGARGGALDLRRHGTGSTFVRSGGRDDAELNGFEDGVAGVDVAINNPPTSGNFSGNVACVEAIVSKSFPTTLMRIASATGYSVSTRAVACVGADDGPECIISMYCGTQETGLQFNGNASVTVNNCNVAINSQADPSILFNGGGNCGAGDQDLVVNGGIVAYGGDEGGTLVNNGSNYCIDCPECPPNEDGLNEAVDGMNWLADPYCDNMQPLDCNAVPLTYAGNYPDDCRTTPEDPPGIPFPDPDPASAPAVFNLPIITNGNYDKFLPICSDPAYVAPLPCTDTTGATPVLQLKQGYYVGTGGGQGLTMNGGAVNLDCPNIAANDLGCMFFTDVLNVNGATLTGTNVTVYATNVLEGIGNNLAIDIGANSTVMMSAPTDASSLMQNMLLFNSRKGNMGCNVLGDADSDLDGTIYCATGFLTYGGNITFDLNSDNAAIIGYQIQFAGNPQVGVSSTGGGGGATVQFSEVKLVE